MENQKIIDEGKNRINEKYEKKKLKWSRLGCIKKIHDCQKKLNQ